LMHTGVRVGRKTYVIDMAEGDQRTAYVAVSNTALGLVLLLFGGISSALATIQIFWALLCLAATGLVGVYAGARLPEVSKRYLSFVAVQVRVGWCHQKNCYISYL